MKPTVAEQVQRATGRPPGYCDASGQYLGYGTPYRVGDVVACEVCGKRVRLRRMLSRGFTDSPAYPHHKSASAE